MPNIPFYHSVSVSLPRKILFLGDVGIGKTTFIRTFCDHMRDSHRCESYTSPFLVFTQYIFYSEPDGKELPFQLLDLPTGTTAESRRDQYPSEVASVVLCFAVDNPTSFANVSEKWFPEFRQCLTTATRYHLLGLKTDLIENREIATVSSERAREIHEKNSFFGFYSECSAIRDAEGAVNALTMLIFDVLDYEQYSDDDES